MCSGGVSVTVCISVPAVIGVFTQKPSPALAISSRSTLSLPAVVSES